MATTPSAENFYGDATEPIAICGMACRFPGEGSTPAGFWDMISNGRTAHREVPPDRFDVNKWHHPNPDKRGTIGPKSGYFINEDLSLFDAPFFSITAKEANGMDPMHRWILEVSYEALENAGVPMTKLPGSDTGVFMGCFTNDFAQIGNYDCEDVVPYAATGSGLTMLSNRVSWFFDLRGSSFTVDTACSSTMYALHLACQSLRLRESKMAIVGGTNLIMNIDMIQNLTKMRMLSPDGVSHSFDARANGYARGEGIASLILKPLSEALKDGDTIRAVIRGSGLGQDGKTPGITMPSAQAQADLIRSVYAKAGLPLNETGYFEAHGTGTPLGDPLEMSALGATFGAARTDEDPRLYVSSVKTNVGHTEGCSALAGVLKAVLSLERGKVAPNAGLQKLNPKLKLDEWKIHLPVKEEPWPIKDVRRVSINSFGYGGANAHVVIDDAASYFLKRGIAGKHQTVRHTSYGDDDDSAYGSASSSDLDDQRSYKKIFGFSSNDQAGLARLSSTYSDFLTKKLDKAKQNGTDEEVDFSKYIDNLAYTLNFRRSLFDFRSFAVAGSLTELRDKLDEGLTKLKRATKNDNIIFAFTGQGAQWCTMGRELTVHPVYRASLERTQKTLDSLQCPWNVIDELNKPDCTIDQPNFSQPLCSAVQIALVDLLSHWGVKPKAVVGHSSGEIGAAYCAGAITQESAIKAAYLRGVYSADVNRRLGNASGAMMAAGLSEEEAQPYLEKAKSGKVVVACINSPSSVTLSGDKEAINEVEEILKSEGKFARKLRVHTAYHSHHMQKIADDYFTSMGKIETKAKAADSINMFSSVTGGVIDPTELDASYWVKNMVSAVRFSDAVKSAVTYAPSTRGRRKAAISYGSLIEVGPAAALAGPLNQTLKAVDQKIASAITYTSVLQRGKPADETALQAAAIIWGQGYSAIDLSKVNMQEVRMPQLKHLSDLPAYPWNHSKGFWYESENSRYKRFSGHAPTDILGRPAEGFNPLQPQWRNFLSINEQPWLEHHKITESTLFPGAGMLIMVLEAGLVMADPEKKLKGFTIRDVKFERGLVIPAPEQAVETSLKVAPHKSGNELVPGWYSWTVFSRPPSEKWIEHSSGLFSIVYENEPNEVENGYEAEAEWKAQTEKYHEIKKRSELLVRDVPFYKDLKDIGMGYGPLFTNMERAWAGDHFGHGTIKIPDTKSVMPNNYERIPLIHPATLDAIFHLLFIGFNSGKALPAAAVPVSMESMFISADLPQGAGNRFVGYTYAEKLSRREGAGAIVMSDEAWSGPKIVIRNFAAREVTSSGSDTLALDEEVQIPGICTTPIWKEDIEYLSPSATTDLMKRGGEEAKATNLSILSKRLGAATDGHIKTTKQILDSVDANHLKPHLRRYVHWLRDQQKALGTTSAIRADRPKSSDISDDNPLASQLRALSLVGDNIGGLLIGEMEAEDVADQNVLQSTFLESPLGLDQVSLQLHPLLDRLCHKHADLSVLIVGNSMSSVFLDVAREFSPKFGRRGVFDQLTFTEKTKEDLDAVQEKLAGDRLGMNFKLLDLQTPLEDQDLEAGSYDLILAGLAPQLGVSIDQSLTSLKSLLKAGGRLALSGFNHIPSWVNFTRGIFEGWWNDQDVVDIHKSKSQWAESLQAAGFTGVDAYVENKDQFGKSESAVVVSRSPKDAQEVEKPEEIVVLEGPNPSADATTLKDNIAKRLLKQGIQTKTESVKNATNVVGKPVISLVEVEDPYVIRWTEEEFEGFRTLVLQNPYILWITRATLPFGCTRGMLRTIRTELPHVTLPHLAVWPNTDLTAERTADSILEAYSSRITENDEEPEMEIIEKDGTLRISRYIANAGFDKEVASRTIAARPIMGALHKKDRPLKLTLGTPGAFNNLRWEDDEEAVQPLGADEVEIRTVKAGLNTNDVAAALGQIDSTIIGREASGIVTRIGENVTGIWPGQYVTTIKNGAARTFVRQHKTLVQEVPDDSTPAAMSYTTAYYALCQVARIMKGESVLVHGAAGGLGQAAIQIATHLGAKIFATVGSNAKKNLLVETYGIPADHIFSSRDATCTKGVMRMTQGKGVDVVLNNSTGDAFRETWRCISDFGRFIEIGGKVGNHGLDMAPFKRHVTFSSIDMERMLAVKPSLVSAALRSTCDLLRRGVFREIVPTTTYSVSDVKAAFNFMESGGHSGKVVLDVESGGDVPIVPTPTPPLQLDPTATYVLSGGLGGIGKYLALVMINHGARHIVFLSRSGAKKDEQKRVIRDLEAAGCQTDSVSCDVSDSAQLEQFLEICDERKWRVKGVVQMAMVLRDVPFENMTFESWKDSVAAKIQGTWNLHSLMPRDIDFFINMSSISGVIGNSGQANYCAGNCYQDAIAHFRRGLGLPATTVAVGVVSDVETMTINPDWDDFLEKHSHMASLIFKQDDLMMVMRAAMKGTAADGTPVPAELVTGLKDNLVRTGGSAAITSEWMKDRRFDLRQQPKNEMDGMGGSGKNETVEALKNAETLADAAKAIEDALKNNLAQAMTASKDDIDGEKPLHAYGVDSLKAVEVRNWVFRELKCEVSVFDILSPTPMSKLALKMAGNSKHVSDEIKKQAKEAMGEE